VYVASCELYAGSESFEDAGVGASRGQLLIVLVGSCISVSESSYEMKDAGERQFEKYSQ